MHHLRYRRRVVRWGIHAAAFVIDEFGVRLERQAQRKSCAFCDWTCSAAGSLRRFAG